MGSSSCQVFYLLALQLWQLGVDPRSKGQQRPDMYSACKEKNAASNIAVSTTTASPFDRWISSCCSHLSSHGGRENVLFQAEDSEYHPPVSFLLDLTVSGTGFGHQRRRHDPGRFFC
jgi:hypothetical protein